jgi:hypothetical protein
MSFFTVRSDASRNEGPNVGAENSTIRSGSFEGRRVVNVRANACKIAAIFTLILIGSSYLGSYGFGDQDHDISGLTSRTYEAVNIALLIGFLTLQHTRSNERLKNPFESGKVCSYEFFAGLMAVHIVTYSFFFLKSSSTHDSLSAGIYGGSLSTVLVSYASVYKEQKNVCEIDLQDEYHCIEDVQLSIDTNRTDIQSEGSVTEGVNGKICKIVKASIPLLWGIGSACLASLCFHDQQGLNSRVYEAINVGLVLTLLNLQQIRPNTPLKNPFGGGRMLSYEFFATLEATNTVAYSLLFLASPAKNDPISAGIYGGILSAVINSYASSLREHVKASKDEHLRRQIQPFFDYNRDDRRISVAINEDLSSHSILSNDARGYTQYASLPLVDNRS